MMTIAAVLRGELFWRERRANHNRTRVGVDRDAILASKHDDNQNHNGARQKPQTSCLPGRCLVLIALHMVETESEKSATFPVVNAIIALMCMLTK